MPGIGIILNPHSRSNRKDPERVRRLGFIVGDKGSCRATEQVNDLPTIIREFKERDIDILGISGGDGTNHCTLTNFINGYGEKPLPRIAFLRGGTMNAIATALGIHGSPEQVLSNLILKYHEDREFEMTEVDLLNINGLYGFLFGNGLVSRFIELYYAKGKGGPMDALWLFLKVVGGAIFGGRTAERLAERFNSEVTVGGEKWGYKNFTFISAGTMEDFCFGFKPFYRARSEAGKFQILGCSAKPRSIIASMPDILLKRPHKKYFEDSLVSEAVIKLEKPETYMVDGDMQPATDTINLKIGPRLKIIIR